MLEESILLSPPLCRLIKGFAVQLEDCSTISLQPKADAKPEKQSAPEPAGRR
jgi:hypothetical protein